VTEQKHLSYRQIMVGGLPAGLRGVDEVFQSLYTAGQEPSEDLGPELVARVRAHANYIHHRAEQDYADALLREYRSYYMQRQSGQTTTRKRQPWRGIPREQIPWFPTVDPSRCDGCDKCLDFCGSGVYAKGEDGVICVTDALSCQVGCNACERLCSHKAITFPPLSILRTLVR